MADNRWKKHFLGSGVPLEHEVAQILAREGFFVDSEFEYLRPSPDGEKEFSVDVSGKWYRETKRVIQFTISILAECKYRSAEKTVVLFEDPNLELPKHTLGHTLAGVDEFSPFHLNMQPVYDLESAFPSVYKGIEVHTTGAVEQDLRHAINQLKYAAPLFMMEEISLLALSHPDERHPPFLTRLLVTNAPLRVVPGHTPLHQIENCEDLEEISYSTGAAILVSNRGPDFRAHYQSVVSKYDWENMSDAAERTRFEVLDAGKKTTRIRGNPTEFLADIRDGRYSSFQFTTQVFVVTLNHLPTLLSSIKKVCVQAFKSKRKSAI